MAATATPFPSASLYVGMNFLNFILFLCLGDFEKWCDNDVINNNVWRILYEMKKNIIWNGEGEFMCIYLLIFYENYFVCLF